MRKNFTLILSPPALESLKRGNLELKAEFKLQTDTTRPLQALQTTNTARISPPDKVTTLLSKLQV